MTQSIANMAASWLSNANSTIAIGMNVGTLGINPNTESRVLSLKVNSNTVFDVDGYGRIFTANGISTSNIAANNVSSGNVTVVYVIRTPVLYGNVYGNVISTGNSSFTQLPNANTVGAGARAFVYDATTTTFASAVIGGGANRVPVYSNGRNWLIG
jgi:hypothetical protein